MKHYLLVDCNDDYKELKSYEELKQYITTIIKDDVIYNSCENSVVEKGVNLLANIITNNTLGEVKKALEWYGYKIIDLLDLQRDLEDTKQYFDKNYYTSAFVEVIAKINDEVNK